MWLALALSLASQAQDLHTPAPGNRTVITQPLACSLTVDQAIQREVSPCHLKPTLHPQPEVRGGLNDFFARSKTPPARPITDRQDYTTLFLIGLECRKPSAFADSFSTYLKKHPALARFFTDLLTLSPDSPAYRAIVRELRQERSDTVNSSSELQTRALAMRAALQTGEPMPTCFGDFSRARPEDLDLQVAEFRAKLGDKPLSTLNDLYTLANDSEKQLLHFLYGSPDKDGVALADILIGTDKANYYRNRLVNPPIPSPSGASTVESLLGSSVPASLDWLPKALVSQIQAPESQRHLARWALSLDLAQQSPEAIADIRRYLSNALDTLQKSGAQSSNLNEALQAERVRTLLQDLLVDLDNRSGGTHAQWQKELLNRNAQAILGDEGLAALPAPAARKLLSITADRDVLGNLTPEQVQKIQELHAVQKNAPQDVELYRATQGLGEGQATALESELRKTAQELHDRIWQTSDRRASHFYGRTLAKERKTLTNSTQESDVEAIARALAAKGMSLTAQDRLRLYDAEKGLRPFSRKLLAQMLLNVASGKDAGSKRAVNPSLSDLAQIALHPQGKDTQVFALAYLSWLGEGKSPRALLALVEGEAGKLLSLKTGERLSDAESWPAEKRQRVARKIEDLLRSPEDISLTQRDALTLAAEVLREWGHSSAALHQGITVDSAGDVLQVAKFIDGLAKRQEVLLKAEGLDGNQVFKATQEMEKDLGAHGYGLPLKAELGLQKFLWEGGAPAEESLLQLRRALPPAKLADLIARLDLANSTELIAQTMKAELPHAMYVLTDPGAQSDRMLATAVKELSQNGKLSKHTQDFLQVLSSRFPHCEEKAECIEGALRDIAAVGLLEQGQRAQADKLLKSRIASTKQRSAHLAQLEQGARMQAQARKLSEKAPLTLDELSGFSGYLDDAITKAEAERVVQASEWKRLVRKEQRSIARLRTRNAQIEISLRDQLRRAQVTYSDLLKKKRQIYAKLSDEELAELEGLPARIRKLAPPSLSRTPPKGIEEARRLVARQRELRKKSAVVVDTWTDKDQEALDLLQKNLAGAGQKLQEFINEPRDAAILLLDKHREAGAVPSGEQFVQNLGRVIGGDLKDHPEGSRIASEILRLKDSFAETGKLLDAEGKPYTEEKLRQLARSLRELASPDTNAPLSAQIGIVLEACKSPCALTEAELGFLGKLQKSPGINQSAQKDRTEEEALRRVRENDEVFALVNVLLDNAREADRIRNQEHAVAMLESHARKSVPKASEQEISEIVQTHLSAAQGLERGKALAEAIARSPDPTAESRRLFSKMSPEKFDAWIRQSSNQRAIEDWLWKMTSGAELHRISDRDAKAALAKMLDQAQANAERSAKRKKEIEAELSAIVSPTGSQFAGSTLWNWDDAKLHLLCERPDCHMTQAQFQEKLDEYARLSAADEHALNPGFYVSARGSDEFQDFVHERFLASQYGANTIALNPHTVLTREDPATGSEAYVFADYRKHRPEMERVAKRLSALMASNGELRRAVDRSEETGQSVKRVGTASANRIGSLVGMRSADVDTDNDRLIEALHAEITQGITGLEMLGNAPIQFDGKEQPASSVAAKLRESWGVALKTQKLALDHTQENYDLAEEGIYLTAALAVPIGGAIGGAVARGTNYAFRGTKALQSLNALGRMAQFRSVARAVGAGKSYRRLAAIAKVAPRVGQVKMLLDTARRGYGMGKMGATSSLVSLPISVGRGAHDLYQSLEKAEAKDEYDSALKKVAPGQKGNGVPDWLDFLNAGKPYLDLEVKYDKDKNGIPDGYDVFVLGMSPEKYLLSSDESVGALRDVYKNAKGSAMTMGAAGLANPLVGRYFMRPFVGKPLSRIWSSGESVTTMFEPMAGMFASRMFQSTVAGDPRYSLLENVERNLFNGERLMKNLKSAGWNSIFMSPIDDYLVFRYLKKNPYGSNQVIWGIKSAVNHGIDAAQGASEVLTTGEYVSPNGMKTKSVGLAALLSLGESGYMSQKTSKPQSALFELLPKIVEEDIRRISAQSAAGRPAVFEQNVLELLNREMGRNQSGPITVRDLILSEADLQNYKDKNHTRAVALLIEPQLLAAGISKEEGAFLIARALDKTGKVASYFDELKPFVSRVIQEKQLSLVAEGKGKAEDIFRQKNAVGGSLNLHRRLSLADAVLDDGTGFKNPEVEKMVDRVAQEHRLEPARFREFALAHYRQNLLRLEGHVTLRTLAQQMRAEK